MPWRIASASTNGLNDDPAPRPEPPRRGRAVLPRARFTLVGLEVAAAHHRLHVAVLVDRDEGGVRVALGWSRVEVTASHAARCMSKSMVV